jgi:hypothetical protein
MASGKTPGETPGKRVYLDKLLLDQLDEAEKEVTDSGTTRASQSVTPKKEEPPNNTPSKPETDILTESETSEVPKYLQLERKEIRLSRAQQSELTELSRDINKARKGKGERITENTLIRIAIELLLKQKDNLTGVTELELLNSVTPKDTN